MAGFLGSAQALAGVCDLCAIVYFEKIRVFKAGKFDEPLNNIAWDNETRLESFLSLVLGETSNDEEEQLGVLVFCCQR